MNGKRLVGLLILLVLVLSGTILTAGNAENARNPLAIDMVIVIENSARMNSMDNSIRKLDKDGLRFDAAAALIGMCDSKYSRAGYFLFNKDTYVYSATTSKMLPVTADEIPLYDISLPAHKPQRQNLIETLNGDRIRDVIYMQSKPDIGKAFSAAVSMQMREKNNGNRKVILLLTSARNSDVDNRSMELAREAKRIADENEIEIYVVAVTDSSATQFLQELVTKPDNYQFANNTDDLVDVYRNFFAAMIGSNPMESESVKIDDGKYGIDLNIPNNSVAEVNIILPLKNVDDLTLVDPDGKTIVRTEDNVMVNQSKNFISYKLISPKSNTYHLTYSSGDEKSIVVQYVFSYGVQVETSVSSQKLNKHEPVTIKARYMVDGLPTGDSKLYNIPATLTLTKDGKLILVSNMEHNQDEYYITLTDLEKEGTGTYDAVIHFEGDGLKRDSEQISFELVNNAPELISQNTNGTQIRTTINIPRDADSYDPEKNKTSIDLSEYVKDINGDQLKAEITHQSAEADAAIDGMILNVKPKKDQATNGEIRILTKDEENAEGPELVFPVIIDNFEDRYDSYSAKFDPIRQIEKNSTCELTLRFYDAEGNEIRQDDQIPDEILAVLQEPGTQAVDVKMVRNGTRWTGSFSTGNKSTDYSVTARIKVGQKIIAAEAYNFSSENKAPVLKTGAKDSNSWNIIINEPSDPESYKVKQQVWKLNDLVEDPNGDSITFEVDQEASTAEVNASINQADQTLTITTRLNQETNGDIVVKCKDNDEVSGPTLKFHISITSNEEKYKKYSAELMADGHGKNKEIVFTLSVLDEEGLLVTGDRNLPDTLDASCTLENVRTPLQMNRGEDGKWTGVLKTADKEAIYTITASVRVSDNISIVTPEFVLNTQNTAPSVRKQINAEGLIPAVINIEPFLLWKNETGDIVIPDLNDYYADSDGDTLSYKVNVLSGNQNAEITVEGTQLRIHGISESSGNISFTVTATDNEGLEATCDPVSFGVKSLKKQGIMILAMVAAAIVVLLIVIQMMKPSFHNQCFDVSTKKKDGQNLSQGSGSNLKGKKAVKLGNYTTPNAKQVCGMDIPVSMLDKVSLSPAYGDRVKVTIGAMGTATVRIGTTKLTEKKAGKLPLNGTLTIENNDTEIHFRLQRPGSRAGNPAAPGGKPATTAAGTDQKTRPAVQRSSRT